MPPTELAPDVALPKPRVRWMPVCVAVLWAVLFVGAALLDEPAHALGVALTPKGALLRKILNVAALANPWWLFLLLGIVLAAHARRRVLVPSYCACLAVCFGALHLLKFAVGRARPNLGLGPWHFQPFGDPSAGFDAFPSGHVTHAVLWAALIGVYIPPLRWVFGPLAVLVCLNRVALEWHWATDVVGAIGLVLLVVWAARRWLPTGWLTALRREDFAGRAAFWPGGSGSTE